MQRLVILGSTGSIGRQTLDVVARHPERYAVIALVAGRNHERLAEQVRAVRPRHVVVADAATAEALRATVSNRNGCTITHGWEAMCEVAQLPEADIVVAAIVGAAGLRPTYAALAAGKRVALANKETLVVAGELMQACARRHGAALLPVDSEHSAVYQALQGNRCEDVVRMTLTASGGPFRERPLDTFASITPAEALRHPNWNMGAKVTIDSATMMNKGLEVIEAHWLFGIPPEQIDVVVHPQSIVHALVGYRDGAVMAQLAVPDMRAPIAYALAAPERIVSGIAPLELARIGTLAFASPNPERYPCLALARAAVIAGKSCPAVLNAANEVAVAAFLDGKIPFTGIPRIVEKTLAAHAPQSINSIDEALAIDAAARRIAQSLPLP